MIDTNTLLGAESSKDRTCKTCQATDCRDKGKDLEGCRLYTSKHPALSSLEYRKAQRYLRRYEHCTLDCSNAQHLTVCPKQTTPATLRKLVKDLYEANVTFSTTSAERHECPHCNV